MNVRPNWGYGLVAAYTAFATLCMAKMSGGVTSFLDPVGLTFLLWAVSPVVFVAWRQGTSKLWWIALLPITFLGAFGMYEMAFQPGSSTAALGLSFVPIYQWAFVGLVALAIVLANSAESRGSGSNDQ